MICSKWIFQSSNDFSFAQFRQRRRHFLILDKKIENFHCKNYQNIRRVTRYIQTQSTTTITRNPQVLGLKIPPARCTILRRIRSFSVLGNDKNRSGQGSSSVQNRRCKQAIPVSPAPKYVHGKISCRFKDSLQHHTEHLKKAVSLAQERYTLVTTKLRYQLCFFSVVNGQHAIWFRYFTLPQLLCLCMSQNLITIRTLVLGYKNTGRHWTLWITQRRVTDRSVGHVNRVVGPY